MANQQRGPFASQFEQPYQAPRNPAAEAGMGGSLSGIAHVATQFLGGMAENRLANQYRQEMQRQKNISALTALMQQAEQSDLTPAAKQQFSATLMQRLAHEVAGTSSGDKKADGGNPVVSWFKNAASSIIGPNPGKVAPIDDAFLEQAYQTLQRGPKIRDLHNQALADLQEAMLAARINDEEGNEIGVDEMTLRQHPKFMSALQSVQSAGMGIPDTFKVAMGTRVLSPEQVQEIRDRSMVRGIGSTPQGAAPTAMPQEQRPMPDVPQQQGPFAGNALMQMFAPQAGSVGSGQQVTTPTSAVPQQGQGAGVSAPPFVSGTLSRQQLEALARSGGKPEVSYLIDKATEAQTPFYIYPSMRGKGIGVGENGEMYDLSKVDANRYFRSNTPRAPKNDSITTLGEGLNIITAQAKAAGLDGDDLEQVKAAWNLGANGGDYNRATTTAEGVLNRIVARRNKAADDKLRRDEIRVRNQNGTLTPVQKAIEERSLRSRWDSTPIMRSWSKLASNYRTVNSSLDLKDGAGDVAAIKSFMIMTDPQTGVRDAEYVVGQQIGGPWEGFKAQLERIMGGTEKMTPKTREMLRKAAGAMYNAGKMDRDDMFETITLGASAIGADPRRIVPGYSRIKQEIDAERGGGSSSNADPFNPKAGSSGNTFNKF